MVEEIKSKYSHLHSNQALAVASLTGLHSIIGFGFDRPSYKDSFLLSTQTNNLT